MKSFPKLKRLKKKKLTIYNMSEEIKKIRKNIDSIDNEILELLNKRASQAINISKEKQS